MARLQIPDDFPSQKTLLDNIITQHNADGNNSVLKPYLTQNNINLTVAATDAVKAENFDKTRQTLAKQSTNYTQLRDLQINPVISNIRGEIKFLKTLFGSNHMELGNWGVTITTAGKITYPTGFEDWAALAVSFMDKHLTYSTGTSPLDTYLTKNKINIANDIAAVTQALTYNSNSTNAAKNAENATEQRNNIWQPILLQIKGIGNYLMNLYGDNPKGLVVYGFSVDVSPVKPKLQTSKIKLGDKITIKGIVIGSTLNNIGSTDIHLYKGNSTSGNPIIVHAGEGYGIVKGYSTVTISNPNSTTEAKITVLRSQ